MQTQNNAIKNDIIRLQQEQSFWCTEQSMSAVSVACQPQPKVEALPVPSGGWHPWVTTGLSLGCWKSWGMKKPTCILHTTRMALINLNYFIVQSICWKYRSLWRGICWQTKGIKCPLCPFPFSFMPSSSSSLWPNSLAPFANTGLLRRKKKKRL